MQFLFGISGRIGRTQWWMAQGAVWIVIIAWTGMIGFDTAEGQGADGQSVDMTASYLFLTLGVFLSAGWITVASTIQRYHDRDKSMIWYFINLIPLIGPIWQIVECGFLPGTAGENSFGPPPGGGSRAGLMAEIDAMRSVASSDPRETRLHSARPANPAAPQTAVSRPIKPGFGRRQG